jgi:hypothetical protein
MNTKGARRCVCGYVFVFEEAVAPADESPRGGSRQGMAAPLGAVALAATVAAAVLLRARLPAEDGASPTLGPLLIAVGAFAVSGAIGDWGWFMGNRRARLFVLFLGRTGARYFYALLGGGLAGAGVGILL